MFQDRPGTYVPIDRQTILITKDPVWRKPRGQNMHSMNCIPAAICLRDQFYQKSNDTKSFREDLH